MNRTSVSLQLRIAERIEDIRFFPEIDEAVLPDVAGGQRHVGAGCQLAVRRHAGVIRAGQTTAAHVAGGFRKR